MLLNYKNYKYLDIDKFVAMIDEEEEMNNIRIVDGYSAALGESFIYGQYEFSGGNTVVFPGELFKSWTTERVISSGTYSGTVDACGNVTLSPDLDSVDVNASFESCIVRVDAPPPPLPSTWLIDALINLGASNPLC